MSANYKYKMFNLYNMWSCQWPCSRLKIEQFYTDVEGLTYVNAKIYFISLVNNNIHFIMDYKTFSCFPYFWSVNINLSRFRKNRKKEQYCIVWNQKHLKSYTLVINQKYKYIRFFEKHDEWSLNNVLNWHVEVMLMQIIICGCIICIGRFKGKRCRRNFLFWQPAGGGSQDGAAASALWPHTSYMDFPRHRQFNCHVFSLSIYSFQHTDQQPNQS